ncbi:MAG: NAD-dependent epimerase/dehydratase family protein [Oscillospiraceae bacterium]|nr:NAD-dependent epimerase/dehydratase family protein [Oscillospiraceae bacterium]
MSRLSVITGASGFLGHALLVHLLERGERVRILLRKPLPRFEGMDCETVIGDITQPESLLRAFAGADVVYHLAGVIELGTGRDEQVWAVNFEGTGNVTEACKACGVRHLIYASSVDAMPPAPRGEVMAEPEAFSAGAVNGAYAKSKAAASQLVLDSAGEELRVAVLMPSAVIGPYDYKGSAVGALAGMFVKRPFPFKITFGGYNFVDVRDVARAMQVCAENGSLPRQSVYLLSGEYLGCPGFLATLAELTGRKPPRVPIPYWLAMAFAPLAELYYKYAKQTPLFSRYSIRKITENGLFSHEKAARDLGYAPRDARESLTDMIEWMVGVQKFEPMR